MGCGAYNLLTTTLQHLVFVALPASIKEDKNRLSESNSEDLKQVVMDLFTVFSLLAKVALLLGALTLPLYALFFSLRCQ